MGRQHTSSLGQPRDLSPHRPYRSSPPYGGRITFHRPPQGLGRCPKTASRYGLSPSARLMTPQKLGTYGMAISVDKFTARQGHLWWWRLWRCYLPLPLKDLTGHTFLSSCMRVPTICSSRKTDISASCPKEKVERPKWADKPTENPLASNCLCLWLFSPQELNGDD